MPLLTDLLVRIKTTKVTQLYPDLHANNRPVSKFTLSKQKFRPKFKLYLTLRGESDLAFQHMRQCKFDGFQARGLAPITIGRNGRYGQGHK